MPRVSDDHLERRRQQILDAARRCFLRKGFHLTSMQDVFAESGLSAGAVYRYFKSKNEIITAIATVKRGGAIRLLEEILLVVPLPSFDENNKQNNTHEQTNHDKDSTHRKTPQVW